MDRVKGISKEKEEVKNYAKLCYRICYCPLRAIHKL
jgi:hypothetical protein